MFLHISVFPLSLGLQCDGCLVGHGRAGLVAGNVGRAGYWVFYHLGVGFAVSEPPVSWATTLHLQLRH